MPPETSPALVKLPSAFFFENALTGVSATLELAKPASEIRINENHLAEGQGVVLKMPVMMHLENPFLGKSCFVGSSGSPINWELRPDATSPPLPNKSITGKPGEVEFLEEGRILKLFNVANGRQRLVGAFAPVAVAGFSPSSSTRSSTRRSACPQRPARTPRSCRTRSMRLQLSR